MKPYTIFIPETEQKRAGIMVLENLKRLLEEKGFQVFVNKAFYQGVDGIAIYPEIVDGNPLGGTTIVRYILYYPGFFFGPKEFDSSDILFTFLSSYMPQAPVLFIPTINHSIFHDNELPKKDITTYFIGKGTRDDSFIPLGSVEIKYEYSEEKKASLLRRSTIFYTWDGSTQLNEIARLCGCEVMVYAKPVHLLPFYYENKDRLEQQLSNFITVTQST